MTRQSISHSPHRGLLPFCIDLLQDWEKTWNMHFNPLKCKIIHITKRNVPIETKYKLHDTTLETVASALQNTSG